MSENNEDDDKPMTPEELEQADKFAMELAAQSNMALQAYIATSTLLAGVSTGITDEAIYVALQALTKSAAIIMTERGGWKKEDMDLLDQMATKLADGLAHPEKLAQLTKEATEELKAKGIKIPERAEAEEDELALLLGAPSTGKKMLN